MNIRVQAANGLFWPEREAKTDDELRLMRRALSITEKGMARAMEVLAACKARRNKRLDWFGRVLTSEVLRAEIDSAILHAGGLPANTIVAGGDQACDPHERGSGPLLADSLIILDIFPRDAASGYYGDMTRTVVRGRASEKQRQLWETVRDGQALALKKMKPGVDGLKLHNEVKQLLCRPGFPDGSARRPANGLLSRHRSRPRFGDSRIPSFPKDGFQTRTSPDGGTGTLLSRPRRSADRRCGGRDRNRKPRPLAF